MFENAKVKLERKRKKRTAQLPPFRKGSRKKSRKQEMKRKNQENEIKKAKPKSKIKIKRDDPPRKEKEREEKNEKWKGKILFCLPFFFLSFFCSFFSHLKGSSLFPYWSRKSRIHGNYVEL